MVNLQFYLTKNSYKYYFIVSQNRDGFNEGIIANFNEPLQTVRCVAWNPHEEGVLACAVDHGLVFVNLNKLLRDKENSFDFTLGMECLV